MNKGAMFRFQQSSRKLAEIATRTKSSNRKAGLAGTYRVISDKDLQTFMCVSLEIGVRLCTDV